MRTALFYSSKGGSGRTLTLANTAWLLVRLGYSVLCVDLDLEAPGIPEALGTELLTSDRDPHANEGFLEYALDQLSGAQDPDTNASTGPLNALPVKGEARLRVIRAGDYVTGAGFAEYVRIISTGTLEGIYAPPGPAAEADSGMVKVYEGFWGRLRAALASYDPDYLLIDTRTGFSPLSATTITEFFGPAQQALSEGLDLVIFAEQGSEGSRRGTQVFLRTLWEERNDGLLPRLTVVRRETQLMKRVTDADSPTESIEEWLVRGDDEPWSNMIGPDSCWTISSDPLVERTGQNLSKPGADLPQRRLLDDYVRLAARIAREEIGTTRARLGLPTDETLINYRLFEVPVGGGLHNVADSQPNISFTIGTFQRLAAALVEANSTTDGPLKTLGVRAGNAYGATLLKQADGDRVLALEEWLQIDSSVGWGQFELVPPMPYDFLAAIQRAVHDPPAESEQPGHVVVNENVFAPRGDQSGNLCGFLGAYIAGIVSQLSGVAMEPAEHPICQSKEARACKFAFAPSDGKDSAFAA